MKTPEATELKPKLKKLTLALDELDYEAVMEAITIRKSGLFRVDGELILPDGDSEPRGLLLAEVCRGWTERVTADIVREARKEV